MGPRFETRRIPHPHLSEVQVDEVRRVLLAAIVQEYTEFERQEAVVVADRSEDTEGLDRAMAALKMFSARAAIESIADALTRLDAGSFGLCSSCGRPIPVPRLERDLSGRSCVDCAAGEP